MIRPLARRAGACTLPRLFHDWHAAVSFAVGAALDTGVKHTVRREVTPAWPFGIWRVRELEVADA